MFNPSPRSRQLQERIDQNRVSFVPQVRIHSPISRHGSLVSIGERRGKAFSPTVGLQPLSPEPRHLRENRKEIITQTKSIAAKAAKKRTTGRYDRRNVIDKTPASMHSLHDVEEVEEEEDDEGSSYLTPSRLSRHVRSHSRNSQVTSRLSDLDEVGSVGGIDKKLEGVDKRVNYRGGVKKIHTSNRQVMINQKLRKKGVTVDATEQVNNLVDLINNVH